MKKAKIRFTAKHLLILGVIFAAWISSSNASFLTVQTANPIGLNPEEQLDKPGNLNPILPGYFADPTIKKFDDSYYLYATTDGNNGGRGPATVWVSKDFVKWHCVPMNWPHTAYYWVPDVVAKDGKYYLYYSQPCRIFAGVDDSPIGP